MIAITERTNDITAGGCAGFIDYWRNDKMDIEAYVLFIRNTRPFMRRRSRSSIVVRIRPRRKEDFNARSAHDLNTLSYR